MSMDDFPFSAFLMKDIRVPDRYFSVVGRLEGYSIKHPSHTTFLKACQISDQDLTATCFYPGLVAVNDNTRLLPPFILV